MTAKKQAKKAPKENAGNVKRAVAVRQSLAESEGSNTKVKSLTGG